MTCRELEARMDPFELVEWQAFDRFPSESWQQCAKICQTIVRAMTGQVLDLAEFMPDRFREPFERPPQTPAELRAALRSRIAAAAAANKAKGKSPRGTH